MQDERNQAHAEESNWSKPPKTVVIYHRQYLPLANIDATPRIVPAMT